MMMKRILFSAALTLTVFSFRYTALAHDPFMLYYAETEPENSLAGESAWILSDMVIEVTGHSLAVDVLADGQLGSAQECLEDLMGESEQVDLMRVPVSLLVEMGCPKLAVLALPGAFSDHEQFARFAVGELGTELLEEIDDEELGMIALGFMDLGFEQFVFPEDVVELADFEGKSIAVSDFQAMESTVESLGGSLVQFPADDGVLAEAFESGEIDGAEMTVAEYYDKAICEQAGTLVLDHHRLEPYVIVMSAKTWNLLTRLERTGMYMAVQAAVTYNAQTTQLGEQMCIDSLKQAGATIVEIEDDAWIRSFLTSGEEAAGEEKKLYLQLREQ